MSLMTMRDLYVHELRDLLSAENQIIKALPKMAKAASSDELRAAFEEHLEQTKEHARRLETIFERMGMTSRGKKCKAVEGLIEEGKETMEKDADESVLDAALIASAQRVEHYEIAAYGCARTYARLLGEDEAAEMLQRTLDEEGDTDKKLTDLAERAINVEAVAAAE
jgi:ferritin-like metal-binding protein YciE